MGGTSDWEWLQLKNLMQEESIYPAWRSDKDFHGTLDRYWRAKFGQHIPKISEQSK